MRSGRRIGGFGVASALVCAGAIGIVGVPAGGKAMVKQPTAFNSVSCVAPESCAVTGFNVVNAFETWNGSSWSTPHRFGFAPQGVSCDGTLSACALVGMNMRNRPVIRRLSGGIWRVVSISKDASLPSPSSLNSVSCVSGVCNSVGVTFGSLMSGTSSTIAVRGAEATGPFVITDHDSAPGGLDSVSCVSPEWCMAVGTAFAGTIHSHSASETWNGTQWSILAPPIAEPMSVSCVTSTFCTVAGDDGLGAPAAASWDGTTWTAATLPTGTGSLGSVSCATVTTCLAVGTDASQHAFADVWDGSNWTSLAVPEPAGSTSTHLYSVSCPTSVDCLAVGTAVLPTANHTLAEHFDGSALPTIVASP